MARTRGRNWWPTSGRAGRSSGITNLSYANGVLLFNADDGIHGKELWCVAPATILGGGVLTLGGNSGDDLFVLSAGDGMVNVAGGGEVRSFPADSVSSLIYDGRGGNDALQISSGAYALRSYGGAGALSITLDSGAELSFDASQALDSLRLNGSACASVKAGGDKSLFARSLLMDEGARLDLFDNVLIVQSTADARLDDLARLSGLIKSARNTASRWQGDGITSSSGAGELLAGLAIILNQKADGSALYAQFAGRSVDANSILVKYTWNGDMDLNGKVDADDYFLIDSGFLSQGQLKGYRNGDLDFSGGIDADDYFLVDSAFLGQDGAAAGSAQALGTTAGPVNRTAAGRDDGDSALFEFDIRKRQGRARGRRG